MDIKSILLKFMCCFRPTTIIENPNCNPTIYSINTQNKNKFNLDKVKGKYYVKSVYDGDTITIIVPIHISYFDFESNSQDKTIEEKDLVVNLNSGTNPNQINYYEIRIRIIGIDTPEMKPSKNLPNREDHIKKAHNAKDFLSGLILNKIIDCEFMQNDKYGRPLAKISIGNKDISELMIEKGHAKPYDGGTKDTDF